MPRILSALRILSAIAVVVIAVLLCGQCLDIYLQGSSPQNLDTGEVHLVSMFRMEDVAARLKSIALPLIVCCLLIAVSTVLHWRFQMRADGVPGSKPNRRRCTCKEHAEAAAARSASIRVVQAILLLISVVLIVLGVMNGGLYDVLVKAINICTECIGLG